MLKPRAWSQLESFFGVPRPPPAVPLVDLPIAVLGGPLGRYRNMLKFGYDPLGLVLQWGGLMSTSTVYVPWAQIRSTSTPLIPVFAMPVESFVLGPDSVLLTLPVGYMPRGR